MDQKKEALKEGKKGMIYAKRTGGVLKRLGLEEYTIEGTVIRPYNNGEGIIFMEESGGEKRIPYNNIVDFVPYMAPPDLKEVLVEGWRGNITLIGGRERRGFVATNNERGVILVELQTKKGRHVPKFHFISYHEVKFPRTHEIIVVSDDYKRKAEEYLKKRSS